MMAGVAHSTSWAQAREILCVRLDSIGDVLMTGPAMRALAAGGRRVTLLTSPAGAAVAQLMPEVAETIVYEAPWMKASPRTSGAAPHLEMAQRLRARRFDAAVIFTVYSQSPLPAAMLCLLAEIPLRLAHCRENPYELLSDWAPETEPAQLRHEVRRQLDLVAGVGAHTTDVQLALAVTPAARARAAEHLARKGIDTSRPWVLVHPGSTAPSRRYPPESLARACATLLREHGVALLFSGDEREAPLVDAVRQRLGEHVPSLAGAVDVVELAALIDAAPLLIAGNTGPVHIAAAVGTPVVDLYALTNPQHTPWAVPSVVLYHDVPCRWCYKSVCPEGHHLCLRGVKPEAIVHAALALLEAPQAVPGAPWREPLRLGGAGAG
jgi:lipopolysaccharide heptosyltransferase II